MVNMHPEMVRELKFSPLQFYCWNFSNNRMAQMALMYPLLIIVFATDVSNVMNVVAILNCAFQV